MTAAGPGRNRLAHEKSPYLLQHASNPVDWYPWGEEAFARARDEDRPIFLSIGYSTCHWCHVMERESFETEEIGRLLNDHFVSIKVDREERPDVDQIYMAVCQALTGTGGWPLTVLLTPDRKPFFAGTYFPPESRLGRPGLKELLYQIVGAWEQQRGQVEEAAGQIAEAIRPHFGGSPGRELGPDTLHAATEQLAGRYDPTHGGFGTAPKFPTAHVFSFLLRQGSRTGDPTPLAMVEGTLQAIRRGGVYDHVGFGVHRYATDREWFVPHFEKMLYDQALLLHAYAETHQATRDPFFGAVAREIATYVLRDLTSPEGAFLSAEDADSEGEEGKFYVWRRSEIDAVLGADEADLYARVYGIRSEGNWRDEATGDVPGTNIPHLAGDPGSVARELGVDPADAARRLEASRRKLFLARERRVHPHKDDKVLTGWNGLMIAALAKGARALGEPAYGDAARRALDFLERNLVRSDGRLLARYRAGEAAHLGYLDDYAFLLWGLIELYETRFEPRDLEAAVRLAGEMAQLFGDPAEGGFFFTGTDAEPLLARPKESYDGAMPSGNSVGAWALLRLARITGSAELERLAAGVFRAFAGIVEKAPSAHTMLLVGLDFAVGPNREIVVASKVEDEEGRAMIEAAHARFLPRDILLWNRSEDGAALHALAPDLARQLPRGGQATAYLCENYACQEPVTTAGELARRLDAPIPKAAS